LGRLVSGPAGRKRENGDEKGTAQRVHRDLLGKRGINAGLRRSAPLKRAAGGAQAAPRSH
jgi:hypothetical protein